MEKLDRCILCDSPNIAPFCDENAFARCSKCGLTFDNPRPDQNEIAAFYSKEDQYDDWLKESSARDAMWKRRLEMILRHRRNGRLLDIGTGIGQFLNLAKAHFEVHGSEISESAVRIANEKYSLNIRRGSLDTLSWEHSFDVLTLFHVLEHVPFPGQTLKKCHSLLSDAGLLVIAVPNDVESILTRRNRVMRRLGFSKYQSLGNLGIPRQGMDFAELHLSHFTKDTLRKGVEAAGFEPLEISLDPNYAVEGASRTLRRKMRHSFYKGLDQLTGKNLYDTLWLVAKKR